VRIAYITTAFPWRSETAVIKEVHELDRLGFDVAIISLKRVGYRGIFDPKANRFRDRTWYPTALTPFLGALHCLLWLVASPSFRGVLYATVRGSGRHLPKALYILLLVPAIIRRLRFQEVCYVHANFASFQCHAAWAVSRMSGIPFGFTVHAHDIFLHAFLIPVKARDARLVVSISKYNVNYMHENFGVPTGGIQVIHCGVDLREFMQDPLPEDGPPLILSVGRLDPMKGFDLLLEACARLAGTIPFRCCIVGKGGELEALKEQAARLGLGRTLEFRTGVPHAELIDLYRRCRVYVQPCRRDAQGMQDGIPATLMEAMAMAKPVISTRLSGIPELVTHDSEGLLVDPEDVAGLTAAMRLMLQDGELAHRLGVSGREKIRREFDVAANTAVLAEQMRRVIAAAR
jgi:glycosyltransferase involved in cell wall biosynthesis